MSKKKTFINIIAPYSLLLGAMYFFIHYIFINDGFIRPNESFVWIAIPSIILAFILIFLASKYYRKSLGGYVSYGRVFIVGFFLNMLANVIGISAIEVEHYFIPELNENYISYNMDYMEENYNLTEEQLELERELLIMSTAPSYRIAGYIISSLLFSVIIPLITSIFVWRKDKTKFSDPLILDSEM